VFSATETTKEFTQPAGSALLARSWLTETPFQYRTATGQGATSGRLRTVLYLSIRTERRAQMLTANATDNPMFVISLDIDSTGQAKTRIPDLEKSEHGI